MKEYIPAGKIVNTHGILGEVKTEVWLDSPAFLKKFKRIFVGRAMKEAAVMSAREQKGCLLMKLEGISDINAAMPLKGQEIFIARSDARLPKGTWFQCDLIGARVIDELGNPVGVLEEIMENPAQPIYIVRGEEEHLIPAVPDFIVSADFSDEPAVLVVHLLPGM